MGAAEDDEGWLGVFGFVVGEVGEDFEVEFGGEGQEGGLIGHTVVVMMSEILIRAV